METIRKQAKRPYLAPLIAAIILFASVFSFSGAFLGFNAVTAYAQTAIQFAGGDGSAESPFLISTAQQFDGLREYLGDENADKHFILANDVDFTDYLSESGAGYNGGKGWEPIGKDDGIQYFAGNFDGGEHIVSGLWINRPDETVTGFFAEIRNANIKNLRLILADKGIIGGTNTGGLAAYADYCTVESCSVTGNVTAAGKSGDEWYTIYWTGGLFGNIGNSTVSGCKFQGSVAFSPVIEDDMENVWMGGITGGTYRTTLLNCYVRADICGASAYSTAGLIGAFFDANVIKNCYAEQTGTERAYPFFGFSGNVFGVLQMTVESSYYAGGFLDEIDPFGEAQTDGLSRRLTADELKDKAVFTGWDFETVWGFDTDGNLVLRAFGGAYDPPPPPVPPDLTRLWITLGIVAIAAAAATASGYIVHKRKKPVFITNTVTETVEVEKIKEVPVTQGQPLPMGIFTPSEKRIAELLLLGKSRREIAEELSLAENTVRNHTSNILDKAEVDSQKAFIAKFLYDKTFFEN